MDSFTRKLISVKWILMTVQSKEDFHDHDEEGDGFFHEEVDISEMDFCEDLEGYLYPCPCGDEFFISLEDLQAGLITANCLSCSLKVKVLYDREMFKPNLEQEEIAGESELSAPKEVEQSVEPKMPATERLDEAVRLIDDLGLD